MSLGKKNLKSMLKDERAGMKEYRNASKKAVRKVNKKKFSKMSADEARHKKILEIMLEDPEEV